MSLNRLFELATPYLEKNDFGVAHTKRVFDIAKANFTVEPQNEQLTFAAIILHDIGGSTIVDQYEKGPQIAQSLLQKFGYPKNFIRQVCEIISTHHDHPSNPSEPFKVLFDSDKLVMFSQQEYPHYNARVGFDWNAILAQLYSEKAKTLAEKWLEQRRKETP